MKLFSLTGVEIASKSDVSSERGAHAQFRGALKMTGVKHACPDFKVPGEQGKQRNAAANDPISRQCQLRNPSELDTFTNI
jgi:hypothetical protein